MIEDKNVKGEEEKNYVWEILIRKVYELGWSGSGIRMRDGFEFMRFEDVEIGLGKKYGGVRIKEYEFRNFEGLFIRRKEENGLDGYKEIG